jgi:hypothetical protein
MYHKIKTTQDFEKIDKNPSSSLKKHSKNLFFLPKMLKKFRKIILIIGMIIVLYIKKSNLIIYFFVLFFKHFL